MKLHDLDHRVVVSTPECLVCTPSTSSLLQGSTVFNAGDAAGKVGRHPENLHRVLQMAFVTYVDPHAPPFHPPPPPACHSRTPPSQVKTGLPPEGLNKSLFGPLSSLSPSHGNSPISLLRMGCVFTREKRSGEKGMTDSWLERKPFYYLPSFLNIPRYCYKRRKHHPWPR